MKLAKAPREGWNDQRDYKRWGKGQRRAACGLDKNSSSQMKSKRGRARSPAVKRKERG